MADPRPLDLRNPRILITNDDGINAPGLAALEQGASPAWGLVGMAGLLAGCFLLAAYSVVGGWSMAYVFRAASGVFDGLDSVSVARLFRSLVSDPERLLAWHTLFLGATMLIVARGLRFGLEQAVRWFVPVLVVCLLGLVGRAYATIGLSDAARFMLSPDWTALQPGAVLSHTYAIAARIGRGGMGTVYLGRHVDFGSRHAIKVISPEHGADQHVTAHRDRDAVERYPGHRPQNLIAEPEARRVHAPLDRRIEYQYRREQRDLAELFEQVSEDEKGDKPGAEQPDCRGLDEVPAPRNGSGRGVFLDQRGH